MANTPRAKADEKDETDTAGSYYYDDAHGYEEFDAEEETDDEDENPDESDEGADLSGGAFDVDLD